MAGNIVPEQPGPKGSEQPTPRAQEVKPAENPLGPTETALEKKIPDEATPDAIARSDELLGEIAGEAAQPTEQGTTGQRPDTIGQWFEAVNPGGTQKGTPASETSDQPKKDTIKQYYDALNPGQGGENPQQPSVTPQRDTVKEIYEAVNPGSTTEKPTATPSESTIKAIPQTGITEVDNYLDHLRTMDPGEFRGFGGIDRMLGDLSSRIEAGGENVDDLVAARTEILDRTTTLATMRNARNDFDQLKRHRSQSEYVTISWTDGTHAGGNSLKIGDARSPIDQIKNMKSYLEGSEYQQTVRERWGGNFDALDSKAQTYLAEMGRLVAEDRMVTTDQITETLSTLREGNSPMDAFRTSDAINERLTQIDTAQLASPDLAADTSLQAESNDLIAARDEINDRFSSLATRRNAQRDIQEIRERRSYSNGINITYTTEGRLASNSLLLGGNNSLEDRVVAIQKAREDPKYKELSPKIPDFDRRLDEYVDEFNKAKVTPATPQ